MYKRQIISNCPLPGSICAGPNLSFSYFINNSASISWAVANGDIFIIGGQGTDTVLIRTGSNFVGGQIIGFDPNGCTISIVLLICNPSDPFTEGWNNIDHTRTVADVNGDGKADVIGFGGTNVFVSFSEGNSFGTTNIAFE